jgi:hypothetical protein
MKDAQRNQDVSWIQVGTLKMRHPAAPQYDNPLHDRNTNERES